MNIFIKVEIIIFLLSTVYVFFFVLEKLIFTLNKFRNIVKPERLNEEQTVVKRITDNTIVKTQKKENLRAKLTLKEKEKLKDLLKRIEVNSSKWYYDTSKNLIIEWLTIDKFNKELNLELAKIYEIEKNYKKAEYIYHDMISHLWNKFILLKALASVYFKQGDIGNSIKYYKKAYSKKTTDFEVIEALSDIFLETKKYKECLKYTLMLLKDKPRSADKLAIKWYCIEKIWKKEDAIIEYKKVLELQPYNNEIIERIQKLQ